MNRLVLWALLYVFVVQPAYGLSRQAEESLFVQAAVDYAARDNAHPPVEGICKMVHAAFVVADLFPDLGPADFYERAASDLGYGYGETRWRMGNVSYNIPHYTPGVNHFSVDMYWSGINEQNLYGSGDLYNIALRLQKQGELPRGLVLIKPPTREQFKAAHFEYHEQIRNGVPFKEMRFHVKSHELTQDDVTSALIYRILEERVRRRLHLPQTYYKGAVARVEKFIITRLHDHGIR